SGRYASFAIVQSPAAPGPAEREGSQRDRESEGGWSPGAGARRPADRAGTVLRDHRLAVGLYRSDGTKLVRTERVELDVSGARTEVPELVGVAQPELLLVNDE